MLVRCNGTSEQNEAVRALMRMRMRCAALIDHTFLWQSSHPDNPKMDKDRTWQWFCDQWKQARLVVPQAVVKEEDSENFDLKICQFRLWYVPKWPTDQIVGKRVRDDGTFHAADKWINRLISSIKKHGILDPLLAWNHVPSQYVVGKPPGTPNVVLGSNRIAVAKHLGIPTVPVIVSYPKGEKPPHAASQVSFEHLHDEVMGSRADLWVTPQDWYLVHPPTRFHDGGEFADEDPQQQTCLT